MVAVFSFIFVLSCAPTALLDLAMPKWNADKDVRIEDAYKWIFQATRGGEHASPDRASAEQWLASEWATLDRPERNEPLWEPLCADETVGRLNLRVFRARGGEMADVLDAFLSSSREYRETGTTFLDTWKMFGERLKRKPLATISYANWKSLDDEMRRQNYPAVHHSQTYEAARHPAYRVLTAAEFKTLQTRLR